jgi:hypothetical protein
MKGYASLDGWLVKGKDNLQEINDILREMDKDGVDTG